MRTLIGVAPRLNGLISGASVQYDVVRVSGSEEGDKVRIYVGWVYAIPEETGRKFKMVVDRTGYGGTKILPDTHPVNVECAGSEIGEIVKRRAEEVARQEIEGTGCRFGELTERANTA